jgi:hypothetical protein
MATVLEACLIAVICSAIGIAVNAARPAGIPLVARVPYETLVPCPEPGGEAAPVAPTDPRLGEPTCFVVDARSHEEASRWRFAGATVVPYDYLDPTPPETLRELARAIASSGARKVVVYGDGDRPDTGELLAREIAGHGIHNVGFVAGGAPALRAASGGGP